MKCKHCGESLFPRQLFCHKCGNPVQEEKKEETVNKSKKNKEK